MMNNNIDGAINQLKRVIQDELTKLTQKEGQLATLVHRKAELTSLQNEMRNVDSEIRTLNPEIAKLKLSKQKNDQQLESLVKELQAAAKK